MSKYGGNFLESFTRKSRAVNKLANDLGISEGAANIMYTMIAQTHEPVADDC